MNKSLIAITLSSLLVVGTAHAAGFSTHSGFEPRETKSGFTPVDISNKSGKQRVLKCSWDGKSLKEGAEVTHDGNKYRCSATYKMKWGAKQPMRTTAYFVKLDK